MRLVVDGLFNRMMTDQYFLHTYYRDIKYELNRKNGVRLFLSTPC
jgi:hypothetical protein